MKYTMNLQPEYFRKIIDGSKTIECRLYDEKRRKLKIGDIIEFSRVDEPKTIAVTEIIELLNYSTFHDLIADFPATFFGAENKSEILNDLHKYYTSDQEVECSVLGIRLKLI